MELTGSLCPYPFCRPPSKDRVKLGSKDLGPQHKMKHLPLAGWLSWLEHCPVRQKFVGSIPNQGTCLGLGSLPGQDAWERQPIDVAHVDVSHSLCLHPSSSLSKSQQTYL